MRAFLPDDWLSLRRDARLARRFDRWLEQVNATALIGQGKYEVSQRLEASPEMKQPTLLLAQVPIAA